MAAAEKPTTLQPFRVTALPESLYYISDFLSAEEELSLRTSLEAVPAGKWTQLSHRRLIALPMPLTGLKKDTLLGGSELPKWLTGAVGQKFRDLRVFQGSPHDEKPNHCLVNEYQPKQGIMLHEDGPGYFACVATVSIASHIVLNLYDKETREVKWRILQEPGSLLVTKGNLYKNYLHGIDEVEEDVDLDAEHIANWDLLSADFRAKVEKDGGKLRRQTRVSFTFRDVLKVKDIGSGLRSLVKK